MREYQISPAALEDIQAILNYVRADSPDAAEQVEEEFFAAFDQLAQWPEMGHTRPDLTDKAVRFWPVGSYLLVYQFTRNMLQMVAVPHGARDIPPVIRDR